MGVRGLRRQRKSSVCFFHSAHNIWGCPRPKPRVSQKILTGLSHGCCFLRLLRWTKKGSWQPGPEPVTTCVARTTERRPIMNPFWSLALGSWWCPLMLSHLLQSFIPLVWTSKGWVQVQPDFHNHFCKYVFVLLGCEWLKLKTEGYLPRINLLNIFLSKKIMLISIHYTPSQFNNSKFMPKQQQRNAIEHFIIRL